MRAWVVAVLLASAFAGCTGGGGADGDADDNGDGHLVTGDGANGQGSETTTSTQGPAPRAAKTWTVIIDDVAFMDSPQSIQRGDTVRWVHMDGPTLHRVETRSGGSASFDSGDMTQTVNAEFEFTFESVGATTYFCRYHEGVMTETIEVVAAMSDADPTPAADNSTDTPQNETGPPRAPVTWEISIESTSFVGGTLTVQRGDTVAWTQRDSTPHTVTADRGEFDSGPVYLLPLPLLDTFSFTFDAVGVYPYHCEVHASMRATVTVLATFAGTPDAP
jgi:plastocyanin